MRNLKKAVSALLVLCMVLISCTPAASAATSAFHKTDTYQGQFVDVDMNKWDGPYIKTAYEYGLMKGYDETHFNPSGTLTLAEGLTLACRIHSYIVQDNATFASTGGAWYQPYVDYASKNKIVEVDLDYINDPCTRLEFAALISWAIPEDALPLINEVYFPDIPDLFFDDPLYDAAAALYNAGVINPYDSNTSLLMKVFQNDLLPQADDYAFATVDAVYRLYNAGILSGSDQYGTFYPNENIARNAVAATVSRIVDPSLRMKVSLTPKPVSLVSAQNLANLRSLRERTSDQELAQAYEIAQIIVTPLAGLPREAQLCGIALAMRVFNDTYVSYSMSAPHYSDPYGFFILGAASCAGCTRATGLCLNMLGIPYEHVNENGYTHQWPRVNVNGTYWICDAYGLYCGPEPAPYRHPRV